MSDAIDKALENIPFETDDGTFVDDYYHNINVNLISLQKDIEGEAPFKSLRQAKDEESLEKIKNGTNYDDSVLRENEKMDIATETYFNNYYKNGLVYKNGTKSTDEHEHWLNRIGRLNEKFPKSSVYNYLKASLDAGVDNSYNEIYGALNSLWDQTHYDFAHVTSNKLDSLQISQMPTVTTYADGETFDDDGLVIDGIYKQTWSDNRTPTTYTKSNMAYTTDQKTNLTYFDNSGKHITSWPATVYDGVTSKTIDVPITIMAKLNSTEFTSISVASLPKKTVYKEGENFDSTGLSIVGTFTKSYSDNSKTTYTQSNMSFSVENGSSLKATQKSVRVSASSDGVERTVEVPITVNKYVTAASIDSLVIASSPNKVKYSAGQKIKTKGMKVNAVIKKTMSDGTTEFETKKNVKVSTSYPYAVAQVGSNTITVTYNYNKDGFTDTKETTITIEVTAKDTHLVNVSTPSKVKLKSVKAGKKKLTVKWKKAKHAKKYRVYYRIKGKKKWKSKTVKKTSYVIKKLKSKKKYQVRVRAINLTAYGKYSKTKTVKVK